MTDATPDQIDGAAAKGRLDRLRAGLKRRHAKETRFKWYGRLAIAAAMIFLAILMVRIVAFAMHAHERLLPAGGISTEDEPDFWRVDDTGAIVRTLIEAGCDIAARDDIGWVPLHYAARFGRASAVEALVRSYEGTDGKPVTGFALVNAATPGGYTPLHAAMENDDPKPAKVLVDSLAAVNVAASGEGTPLQLAVKLGRGPDYVGPLIEGGADVSVVDGRGCSLLHRAVQGCPVETLRLLIDAGIPVDVETPDGFTPLHLAAQEAKDPRVIEFLLNAGADPRGKGGVTPHAIARPEYRDILWKALMDSPLPTRPR